MAYPNELMGVGVPPMQATTLGGLYTAVTAAGSSQTDATTVGASMSVVGSADGTKGVILKADTGGAEVWIFNNSASTLKVYPPSGAAIAVNGTGVGSANAAFSHLTYKAAVYKCLSATQWVVIVSA